MSRTRPSRWSRRLSRAALAAALLACADPTEPPTGFGTIRVTVVSSGHDLDLDGYVITLDSEDQLRVSATGTITIPSVPSGDHVVGLGDIAANCATSSTHPMALRVSAGRVFSVRFDLQCSLTGIEVQITQQGFDLDLDGFTVSIDDSVSWTLAAGFAASQGGLSPGPHTVRIEGVPENCTVAGGLAQTVTVNVAQTTRVTFALTCEAVTGAIEVTSITTGEDFDPDGYIVRTAGGPEQRIGVNEVARINRVAPGPTTVRLEGVTSTCQLQGASEHAVDVVVGGKSAVTFQVSCTRTDVIAFTRGYDSTAKIHLVHANGAGPLALASGSDATWSPDGRYLAFRDILCFDYYYYPYCYSSGIHTTLVHSWSPVLVATDEDGPADWSPDGTTLIFSRTDVLASRLYKVTLSNRIVTRLTIVGFNGAVIQPAWSPDGTRIAFACRESDTWDICVANADGSGFQRVTDDPQPDFSPAWSPDGARLAFTTSGNRIVLIGADGTRRQELTDGLDPAWSPDGTHLVFVGQGGTGSAFAPGLYLINVDGSGLLRLTLDSSDRTPSWRR